MQIHELTQQQTQLNEVDLVGPNSVFNKMKAAKQAGFKLKDPSNAYQQSLNQQTQQAAAQAAAGLQAKGYGSTPAPAPQPVNAVPPGQRIKVVYTPPGKPNAPKSNYYKTSAGWTNELGQPITNPTSVAYLEQLYAKTVRSAPTPAGSAPAVNTRPSAAPAVATGGAQAIMTQNDFNNVLRQANLSRNQIDALSQQIQANPAMAQALLKALGLAK